MFRDLFLYSVVDSSAFYFRVSIGRLVQKIVTYRLELGDQARFTRLFITHLLRAPTGHHHESRCFGQSQQHIF